jgi:hypothetical protein
MRDVDFKVMDIISIDKLQVKLKVAYRNVFTKAFVDMIDEVIQLDKLNDFKETKE